MSSSISIITPPSTPYWKTSNWGLTRIQAVTRSPFTGKQQIHDFGEAYWESSVQLPLMNRLQASPWIAFLSKMKGARNGFLLGDPDARTPLGSVTENITAANDATYTGAVGSSQIRMAGFTPNVGDVFKAGDYIQTGAGATANLYMITDDVDSDEAGIAVANIEPSIRTQVVNSSIITYNNASCVMRFTEEDVSWDVDHRGLYTIGFDVIEVV